MAEIVEWACAVDDSAASLCWEQVVCDNTTTCGFFKRRPRTTYCIRVRSAFTKTKLGVPSDPLFVQLH